MKKALAILATVATVGATTMSAPAEARGWRGGWGPGLAFGLAAGALTAGAVAAGAYRTIMGPATGITTIPQPTTMDLGRTRITADPTIGTAITGIIVTGNRAVIEKPGAPPPGSFVLTLRPNRAAPG